MGMAAGISTAPGPIFSAKQKFPNFIRLNCGNPWSEMIENAVRELGRIIACVGSTSESRATLGQEDVKSQIGSRKMF